MFLFLADMTHIANQHAVTSGLLRLEFVPKHLLAKLTYFLGARGEGGPDLRMDVNVPVTALGTPELSLTRE